MINNKQKLEIELFMEQKGQTSEFKNTIFKGSLSIILGNSSGGNWLMGVRKETINSNVFVRFMSKLDKWISDNHKFGYNEVLNTLDYYSWHFSKLTLIALSKLNLKVMLCASTLQILPQSSIDFLLLRINWH